MDYFKTRRRALFYFTALKNMEMYINLTKAFVLFRFSQKIMKTLCRRLIIQKPKWSRNLILGIESSCDDSGAAIIEYVGKFF